MGVGFFKMSLMTSGRPPIVNAAMRGFKVKVRMTLSLLVERFAAWALFYSGIIQVASVMLTRQRRPFGDTEGPAAAVLLLRRQLDEITDKSTGPYAAIQ